MVKTVWLGRIRKKTHPHVAAAFPTARYMTFEGRKYADIKTAKKIETEKLLKRGCAKPKFRIV